MTKYRKGSHWVEIPAPEDGRIVLASDGTLDGDEETLYLLFGKIAVSTPTYDGLMVGDKWRFVPSIDEIIVELKNGGFEEVER